MKKIFIVLTLVSLFIFSKPNIIHGQLVTNTFSCKIGTTTCVTGIIDCAPGYGEDSTKCTSVQNPNGLTCMATSFPCVLTTVTKYRCNTTSHACVADPNGNYNSWQLCSNTCSAPVVYPTAQPIPSGLSCGDGETGINTAIGCVHVLGTPEAFLGDVLKWAVGIGGGIAFLLILYAGFMIMTSAGNPERLKAGQELLTSAISGLILLIFSIFILKFIGVDILGLCKFGFGKAC